MRNTLKTLALAAALMAVSRGALAEDGAAPAATDRQVYDSLIAEIRADHADLAGAYREALERTRRDGTAPAALQAKILALRDAIDRKDVRLMLVAGRHGWAVPRLEADPPATAPPAPEPDARAQLLPPDPVIAEVLTREAREIAATIPLPVLSLDLPGK